MHLTHLLVVQFVNSSIIDQMIQMSLKGSAQIIGDAGPGFHGVMRESFVRRHEMRVRLISLLNS